MKTMKTMEQIFQESFYGKFKVHRAFFSMKRGKLKSHFACGAKSPKFSAIYDCGVTCKKCKAKIKKLLGVRVRERS